MDGEKRAEKHGRDLVGQKLGSFLIEGILGEGAMGVVYRSKHEKTGKLAAVKVISGEVATKSKAYERFEREGKILQQFRHPNIVQWFALGRYQGTSYFAMEYIAGKTLEQVLAEHPALPWPDVVNFGIQVSEALEYAHEHGVVHRDLKPSNMMINEKGVLKLTDFGIAKDLDATALTATGRTLGTAGYMAPEQIRGDSEISHKTDLYQLGCVMFQLLTGRLPFEGTSAVAMMHGHLKVEPPVPSQYFKDIPLALGTQLPEIPPSVDNLVLKLMSKEAKDRPAHASTVAERLREILEKTKQGEAIPKKWPHERLASVGESLGSFDVKPAASKPKARRTLREAPPTTHETYAGNTRRLLETFGLAAVLVLIVGGFLFNLYRTSRKEYLFEQAKILMDSKDRHDWTRARTEYLDPLDAKYPDNPYKEQTRDWRDQLLLEEAEGRAKFLQVEGSRI